MPPVKRLNQKARSKTSENARVVEIRKERSRDAARNRRGKENTQFDELAKLLPIPPAITSQLDKASIVRLTISFLNMREFSGVGSEKILRHLSNSSTMSDSPLSDCADSPDSSVVSPQSDAVMPFNRKSSSSVSDTWDLETSQHLLEALGGFLLVLNSDAKILYVSESVSTYLGLSQVELTGSSLFTYVHAEDKEDLQKVLNRIPAGDIASTCNGLPNEDGTKPESFLMRMKCTLVRRAGSYAKSSAYRVIHCMGRLKEYKGEFGPGPRKAALITVGQPLPGTNINELTLECDMFVSRVNMDLKIVYCEGRIHKFMDYVAKDIVGMSAYDFYHGSDVALIQQHHAKFLNKGQVLTKYYRWMNKNGGWVWMQTKASLIPHPKNPELKQMLCLNYIVSQVEHRGVVLGMAQMDHKPALGQYISEVSNESEDPLFLDAQIDDQVMPFPNWNKNADKLIPQPTILDNVALSRTGYNAAIMLENDVFSPWSPAPQLQGMETDSVGDDLEDINNLIVSEMSDLDCELTNFVFNGYDSPIVPMLQQASDAWSRQLGRSSSSSSSTIVHDDGSFGGPKLEEISPTDADLESLANSLSPQLPPAMSVRKQEGPLANLGFGASGSCRFGSADRSATNVQTQGLSTMTAPGPLPAKAGAPQVNGLNSWGVQGYGPGQGRPTETITSPAAASVVQPSGYHKYYMATQQNFSSRDDDIIDMVNQMEEDAVKRGMIAPQQQQQQQQHVVANRTASLPARLSHTGDHMAQFPIQIKQEVVTPTSPQPNQPFAESFGVAVDQHRNPRVIFGPVTEKGMAPAFRHASAVPLHGGHSPNRNGLGRCGSLPFTNLSATPEDANMNVFNTPMSSQQVNSTSSQSQPWLKPAWQNQDMLRALLQSADTTTQSNVGMPAQQQTAVYNIVASQQNGNMAPPFTQMRMSRPAVGNLQDPGYTFGGENLLNQQGVNKSGMF